MKKMGKNFMAFFALISIGNVTLTFEKRGLEEFHLYLQYNTTFTEPTVTKFMFARQLLQKTLILHFKKI
jgi:hypothetical protein